ncbi:MAG: hypothetical protein J6Y99_10155 [Bacteroidales bacterium]|nr:hypothetical protein [Bacteroidales bacterium]
MIEHWLEHPEQMGAEAVEKLPQLIDQCPYCATYRMLLCIALANTHSTHLKEEIEKTACALPDRTQLFLRVNNGEYSWIELMKRLEQERQQREQTTPVETSDDDFALIDLYLSQFHLSSEQDPTGLLSTAVPEYPLENLESCNPVTETEGDIVQNEANKETGEENIIDQFLEADEKGELLVPQAEVKAEEAPTPDPALIHEKAFLTESLARLYVKQHKFEQALAIFSQLNLQYSKKSSNFADQIRYIEKILEAKNEPGSPMSKTSKQ